MKRRGISFIFIALWIVLTLTALSCANIVAPSGGPVDEKAPTSIKSDPPDHSTYFSEERITITFDEFITLDDAANRVLVSPPLDENPEYRYRGKHAFVIFNAPLKENTTYTIDFGESVKDITEGIILKDYRYVFSTGPHIDSMKLKGSVADAFSLEGAKGVSVMLYSARYDSVPYLEKPDYVARTNTSGSFEFSGLAPGSYKLFALLDGNANLLFDIPTEKIAFYDSLTVPQYIPLDSSGRPKMNGDSTQTVRMKSHLLYLFQEPDSTQRITKVRADHPGLFRVFFRWPAQNPQFRFLKNPMSGQWKTDEWNAGHDSLTCWITDLKRDSLYLEVSDGGRVIDTLEIGLKKVPDSSSTVPRNKSGKGGSNDDMPFRLIMNPSASAAKKLDHFEKLRVGFLHPVARADYGKVQVGEVRDSIAHPVPVRMAFVDSLIQRKLEIVYAWKPATTYELLILPGAFTDIFGLTNDSLKVRFTTTDPEDYGFLKVNLKILQDKPPYIFQLLNDSKKVIREMRVDTAVSLEFPNLPAGSYGARFIFDRNGNHSWDAGNYMKRRQPEKVMNFPGTISVKANWDTEIDWEL